MARNGKPLDLENEDASSDLALLKISIPSHNFLPSFEVSDSHTLEWGKDSHYSLEFLTPQWEGVDVRKIR